LQSNSMMISWRFQRSAHVEPNTQAIAVSNSLPTACSMPVSRDSGYVRVVQSAVDFV
jgi:hypothetical protein